MGQIDLFAAAGPAKQIPQTPDPDAIRVRLVGILDELRASERLPWTPTQLRSWLHVFPNMANWLPADERDRLRQDFAAEIARLQPTSPDDGRP